MRANIVVFGVLTGFFGLMAVVYSFWNFWMYGRMEWVGTIGFFLSAAFAALVGFYLNRSFHSQGGALPEDRAEASVDDGDPELGFFSPWSWWPFMLGLAGAMAFLSLAVGWWIFPFAVAVFIVSIVGWVYEYYRGYFAR